MSFGAHEFYVPTAGIPNERAGENMSVFGREYDVFNYRVVSGKKLMHPVPIAEVEDPEHFDLRLLWSVVILGKSIQNMAKNMAASSETRKDLKAVLTKVGKDVTHIDAAAPFIERVDEHHYTTEIQIE